MNDNDDDPVHHPCLVLCVRVVRADGCMAWQPSEQFLVSGVSEGGEGKGGAGPLGQDQKASIGLGAFWGVGLWDGTRILE